MLALMDQRNIHQAAVVAHSWGASVALAMALAAPERVTRLALYDAWVYEEQLPTTFLWARASGVGEVLFDLFYAERPDEKIARAFYDPKKYVTRDVRRGGGARPRSPGHHRGRPRRRPGAALRRDAEAVPGA